MEEKEITLYGMLDNVQFSAYDEMHATLCELGMVDSDGMRTFPDHLSLIFTWDATPTLQGLTNTEDHFAYMEPAAVPAWMKDGSYVKVIGVVNGDSITASVITYYEANGLRHSAMAKA